MSKLIAVIGGDARYIELIRQLNAFGEFTTNILGFNKLDQGFTGAKHIDFADFDHERTDVVVLPITGTQKDGKVETVFSDEQIILTKKWFEKFQKTTPVFTGISNAELDEMVKGTNAKIIPLLERDDVAIYNSIPTAEGTIMMAMEHTDYTIHSSRVIVAGFGRVGHTVANKFSALGAKVSVAASSIHDLARITEMGLNAIPLDELALATSQCDILINTIPAPVIDKEAISHLPHHALIFDLASKPGGTDFDYAKQRGIKAILSESLPGIVAPKTAGKILADVIIQILIKREGIK
ncbi:dipicolinic acid synthetase subunit A [Virgibacillus sp. 179-BFC.A HS]|uniref:Dipicolinic acid synthetase subunit A n=1 Tax=Tigheibacillus jepli TaxID=3035914 RepID=A0ABU5CK16_9BACI|nr:dipicolinic acid synthetase subunit A [Virgibacillus sp. 179-BFC.A HS]MDY0405835.1 dipicolinic acid synthetase subunit A [Virgibacillus sp. 179-BFC.A HS]